MTTMARTPIAESGGTSSVLDAAIQYGTRNWPALPFVFEWNAKAGKFDKKPVIKDWPNTATTDAKTLTNWFNNGYAKCGIGIVTGKRSGLIVIDHDSYKDDDSLNAIQRELGDLPDTVEAATQAGGRHRFYSYCPDLPVGCTSDLMGHVGVDVRGDGGFIVVAPSFNKANGQGYRWIRSPEECEIAELPVKWLAALHKHTKEKTATKPAATPVTTTSDTDIVKDEARARAYVGKMPEAIAGDGGHNKFWAVACTLIHGFALPRDIARKIIDEDYNPRCKPEWSDEEIDHKLDDAEKPEKHDKPRGWLRDAGDNYELKSNARLHTDIGNAARFTLQHREDLRFCHATGKWYRFTGQRWEQDNSGEVMRRAKKTALAIYKEMKDCPDDKREELAEHWARSQKRERLAAMVELAKPDMAVGVNDFDADDYLLNVHNGTIDLRTGELREHRRGDLISRLAPVNYDRDAECPRWNEFLGQIFADDFDLIEFVRRLVGMCLTGDVREQIFPVAHGSGANGKSVFADTITAMMGDYAGMAAPHLLTESKQREHPTEIADLMGKRFVVGSESEDGAKLRIQVMKRLTGDKMLKARMMRQDFFEFRRTHKLLLVTNNRPRVDEDTEAAWRRIRLVPFNVTIPAAERDPKLIDTLKTEWPGILRWAIGGGITWQAEGLNTPEAVTIATGKYRQESDDAAEFLAECCTRDATPDGRPAWVGSAQLREAMEAWAKERGEKPIKTKRLTDKMREQGATSEKQCGKRGWAGFRLLDTEERAA